MNISSIDKFAHRSVLVVPAQLLMALQREVNGQRISRVYEAGSQPMLVSKRRGGKEVHVPTLEGYVLSRSHQGFRFASLLTFARATNGFLLYCRYLENKLNNGLRVAGIYRDPLDKELRFVFERISPEAHELKLCAFQLSYVREKEGGQIYCRYEHSSYTRVASEYARKGWSVVGALALPDRTARLICCGPQLKYRHECETWRYQAHEDIQA